EGPGHPAPRDRGPAGARACAIDPPPARRHPTAMRRLAAVLGLCLLCSGCSPLYLLKAGIAEARILAARRPIAEVILDPETDDRTRGLLTIALEARRFALEELRLDAGDSYTSFTQL